MTLDVDTLQKLIETLSEDAHLWDRKSDVLRANVRYGLLEALLRMREQHKEKTPE